MRLYSFLTFARQLFPLLAVTGMLTRSMAACISLSSPAARVRFMMSASSDEENSKMALIQHLKHIVICDENELKKNRVLCIMSNMRIEFFPYNPRSV